MDGVDVVVIVVVRIVIETEAVWVVLGEGGW